MKSGSVLKFLIILLIAVFFVHQAVAAVYKPVTTESADYFTATDGLEITGIIIRNETLVKSEGDGVMHFAVADGSRVAKDGIIAKIYDSEAASVTLSKADELNAKIADMEAMLGYNDPEAADLDMINSKIRDNADALNISAAYGKYESFSEYKAQLLSSFNRRQIAMGETEDFSLRLTELKAELAALNNSLPAAKGTVRAEKSGYFVSETDGYEELLTCDDPDSLTPERLSEVKAAELPAGTVGKIVSDYAWYIAARVSVNESLNYKTGDRLTVYTSVKSYPKLSVTVKQINISESASAAVLIFECSDMNSELASMRSGPMTVVKNEYGGLKVSKGALRVVDSKRGVYVLSGMQVKFVEVNILYSNDSYIICEKQTDDENVLRLYDEVIVKGKNLYDGKIIG